MLLLLPLGCVDPHDTGTAPAPWSEPDQPGPYSAGVTTLHFTSSAGKDLVAEAWYPTALTDAPGDPYPEVAIVRAAHRDAPPDPQGGPYPLVAFSHGSGGIRYQSAFLTEYLAEHGYVVVAVDHVGNTLLDMGARTEVEVLLDRPSDVVASVDEVLARSAGGDPLLGDMVLGETYAMTGHSFGAFTTLAVAGGEVDLDAFTEHCATSDEVFCDLAESIPPGSVLTSAPDPRAVAAVPMAPGGWYAFGADGSGLGTLAPALFWAGTRDPSTPWESEVHPAYLAAGTPKAEALLTDAGHFIYSDLCSVAPIYSDECDPENGYIDIELAHSLIQALDTAWIDVYLRGDARSAPWLDPAEWEQPLALTTDG